MSKKKHRRAQQLIKDKQAIINQLQAQSSQASQTKNEPGTASSTVKQKDEQKSADYRQPTGLLRTMISIVIITAIFIGAVILDQQSDILTNWGNQLYKDLRLAN